MYLTQDYKCNSDVKIRCVLILFRLGNLLFRKRNVLSSIPFYIYTIFYRILVEWFLGIELPLKVSVGARLTIYHGVGLVVHLKTIIGDDVVLRNGVIIGNKGVKDGRGVPILENGVEVGGNAVIIGEITIGSGSKIGAGTVITKDVPKNSVIVAAKARYL